MNYKFNKMENAFCFIEIFVYAVHRETTPYHLSKGYVIVIKQTICNMVETILTEFALITLNMVVINHYLKPIIIVCDNKY